jgi:hypothetical protein
MGGQVNGFTIAEYWRNVPYGIDPDPDVMIFLMALL